LSNVSGREAEIPRAVNQVANNYTENQEQSGAYHKLGLSDNSMDTIDRIRGTVSTGARAPQGGRHLPRQSGHDQAHRRDAEVDRGNQGVTTLLSDAVKEVRDSGQDGLI